MLHYCGISCVSSLTCFMINDKGCKYNSFTLASIGLYIFAVPKRYFSIGLDLCSVLAQHLVFRAYANSE